MCEQPSVRCEEREPTSGFTFSFRAFDSGDASLMYSLRVLTRDVEASQRAVNRSQTVVPCEQTYSCQCTGCEAERAFLMRGGSKDRKQPWERRAA